MSESFLLFSLVFIFSAFLALIVAWAAWQRRNVPGATSMTGLMLAVAWWSLLSALEVIARDLPTKLLCSQLQYLGIATVPVWWFLFALDYSGARQRLTRRTLALLWVIPLLTIVVAFTQGWHTWLWSRVTLQDNGMARYEYGGWFLIHAVYSYSLILGGMILLLRTAWQLRRLQRRPIALLIAGILCPLVLNVMYLAQLNPIPGLDLTTLGFAVAGVVMAWDILRFHLLALGPIARGLLFDSISDVVLVLDLNDHIADLNPAALRFLGLSQPPLDQPLSAVLAGWQEQIGSYNTGAEAEFDLALPQPDRQLRHFNIRLSPLRNRHAQLIGHIVMAHDVTEHHKAEQRMRQLQRAVEQSPTSVVITDTAGHIEYVNPKFTHLTGYSFEEVLGKNPNILKTGHTPPEVYTQMWETLVAGQAWRGEFMNRKKNGELYWEEASMAPVMDAAGRITHYLSVKEDITERKRNEEALRASRARLKAIFDNAAVGITLADRAGNYIQVNRRWAEMVGRSIEELYQLSPTELTHPADRPANEVRLQALIRGEIDSFEMEKRYLRADGSEFWATLSVTAIYDVAGEFEASLGVVSDITARKLSEAAARKRLQELEALRATMNEVLGELDLNKLLHGLVERMVVLLDSSEGELALYDAATRTLTTMISYHQERDFTGLVLAEGEGALGQVALTRQPLIIDDYNAWEGRLRAFPFPGDRLQLLLAPLLSGPELLGVISVGVFEEARQYAVDDVRLIETFAQQAAIAIQNARLFEHTRQRAERLLLVTQVSMDISRSPDLEHVLNSAMDGLRRVLSVDQVSIGLLDEDSQNMRLWAHHVAIGNPQRVGLVIPVEANSSFQVLLETKAPLALEDAPHAPLLLHMRDVIQQQGVQSMLLAPLLVQGRVVGSIGCDVLNTPRRFTTEEIDLAQTVANLLALRIEQTRLLEDERQQRQQTQRREAELRGVIDASRDGILMVSVESSLLVINDPALRLLNLPGQPAAWHGARVKDFMIALRRVSPPAARVARTELRRIDEDPARSKEGDLELAGRFLRWQNTPVYGGDRLMGWLFVLRDLTEDRALKQLREDMTHTMVHDLRNPLTSILGAMELLLDGSLGELASDQTQAVNIARRSSERMLQLVNNILDVTSLEGGHMPITPVALHLPDLVQDTFQSQATLAQGKGIQLISQLPADMPPVKADAHLLQRVLQNLVGNAIKFTPRDGGVTVSAVIRRETPSPIVQVSIRDTGPGIPPDLHNQLFQKFVIGQQKERGSGLGLAFCRLALEAHGQGIWVESTPGQGATFIFTLAIAS